MALLGLLVVAGAVTLGALWLAGRPSPALSPGETREARPTRADAPPAPGGRPDFNLTAQELYDEFVKDKGAAHLKFTGKVIEVSGVVRDCKASGGDSMLVLDVKKKGTVGLDEVYGATQEKGCWARHGRGQRVKLQGRWGGPAWIGAALTHAVVVEAGPNPTVLYGAARLAQEHEADAATLLRRYAKKHLVVEGEVLKTEEQKGSFCIVYLKGTEKTPVLCYFRFHERDQARALRAGQRARVFGELSPESIEGLALDNCLAVTQPTTAAPEGAPRNPA
jgi:hypothetical protein